MAWVHKRYECSGCNTLWDDFEDARICCDDDCLDNDCW